MSVQPPPVSEQVSGADKQFSFGWKRWIQNIFPVLQAVQNYGAYSVSVPASGFAITVPDSTEILQLAPVGTIALGSVTFPATPQDKQRITIATTQTITSLVLVAAAPIFNPATTLAAGQSISYYYSQSNAAWYSTTSGGTGGGGGGTPAGVSTQVQVNYLGAFFASALFTYNPTTLTLTVPKLVGAAIDNSPIGANTPLAGTFTDLQAANILFNADANLHLAQRSLMTRAAPQPQVQLDDSQVVLVGRVFRK